MISIPNIRKILENRMKPKHEVNGVVLSDREYQIFRLVGEGHGVTEIASRLNTTRRNVGNYKCAINRKLGLKHHAQLASYAARERVKEEIKDGDFVRDDLLATWLHHKLKDIKASYLLDLILEFRTMTSIEAWERLKQLDPTMLLRRPTE